MSNASEHANSRRLTIAVCVDQFPELSETFVSGEMQQLQNSGHRVLVESVRRPPNPDQRAAEGLEVSFQAEGTRAERWRSLAWLMARHPVRCVEDVRNQRRWRRSEHVSNLRALAPVARRVSRAGAQHVHSHFAAAGALNAMRIGALLDLPSSVATHGYDIFERPSNLEEKHERAAFAVSDCDYSVDYLRGVVSPDAGNRIHRLVLGVDGARFERSAPYPGGRTVIAVTRLVEKKGLPYLLEATSMLSDAGTPLDRLVIVGDGPLRDQLTQRIADLGIEDTVELVGSLPPDRVRAELEGADLLAMPCVVAANGDRDTMPVVVKEALAMEIPVVATREVGLPEVVKSGWGALAEPRDAQSLARAIQEVLGRPPQERARMGKDGRGFVLQECNIVSETDKLVRLMTSAVDQRSS